MYYSYRRFSVVVSTNELLHELKSMSTQGGNFLKNKEIREYAKSKNVLLWQIADRFGINDGNFSRKLRHEFEQEEKQKIKRMIDELSEETT